MTCDGLFVRNEIALLPLLAGFHRLKSTIICGHLHLIRQSLVKLLKRSPF